MVPTVEMNLFWIYQEEGKEDDEDLEGLFAPIYKVPIEHIGLGRRRKAILIKYEEQVIQLAMQVSTHSDLLTIAGGDMTDVWQLLEVLPGLM